LTGGVMPSGDRRGIHHGDESGTHKERVPGRCGLEFAGGPKAPQFRELKSTSTAQPWFHDPSWKSRENPIAAAIIHRGVVEGV